MPAYLRIANPVQCAECLTLIDPDRQIHIEFVDFSGRERALHAGPERCAGSYQTRHPEVCDRLWKYFPDRPEGQRAELVGRQS